MPSKKKSESNTGLVVTLVFFILTTIGLGVSTYTGYAGQDVPTAEAKKAKDAEKVTTKSRDYYKFQTLLLKGYMGKLQDADLGEVSQRLKDFEGGQLGAGEADRAGVEKLIDELKADKMVWVEQGAGQQKKLSTNYPTIVADLRTEVDKLKKQVTALTGEKKNLERDVALLNTNIQTLKTEYDTKFENLKNTLTAETTKQGKDRDELRTENAKLSADKARLEGEKAALVKARDDSIAKAKEEQAAQQVVIDRQRKAIDKFEKPVGETPKDLRTGWKIVALDRSGDIAYINLGSADKVKAQLRFTVHGVEADGKPNPRDKAIVEVVDVRGDHISRARVMYLEDRHDRMKHPVLQNDVLVNQSWNPNLPKHVALAGSVDLTGEGRDNTDEFLRTLKRQNIIVDAALDLKDLTEEAIDAQVKKVTVQTDFLVIGDIPAYLKEARDGGERAKKINDAIAKMKEQARQNGVRILSLGKYLEMIGYPLPKALATDDRSSTYRQSSEPKNEKPKEDKPKDDKPKDDKKPPMDDKKPPM
jgi:hypothetical protein